jgi:hypothetical protein
MSYERSISRSIPTSTARSTRSSSQSDQEFGEDAALSGLLQNSADPHSSAAGSSFLMPAATTSVRLRVPAPLR